MRGAHTLCRLSAGKCSRLGCGMCAAPLYYPVQIWSSHRGEPCKCASEWPCRTRTSIPPPPPPPPPPHHHHHSLHRQEPLKLGTWDFSSFLPAALFLAFGVRNGLVGSTQPRNACGFPLDTITVFRCFFLCFCLFFGGGGKPFRSELDGLNETRFCFGYGSLLMRGSFAGRREG